MVLEVTEKSFEEEVINSDKHVVIDFWAEWCGPCKMLGPIIEQLSVEMKDKIKIVKMNIDDNPEAPSSLGIRSIPTMMIFKNGKPVATKIGAIPKNSIKAWIDSSL